MNIEFLSKIKTNQDSPTIGHFLTKSINFHYLGLEHWTIAKKDLNFWYEDIYVVDNESNDQNNWVVL